MGDPLTKVLLSYMQLYVYLSVREKTKHLPYLAATIVGDDLVAITPTVDTLRLYLNELTRVGFKVSENDTYISHRFMFYCEECAIVP
jgi:hypothetical protein